MAEVAVSLILLIGAGLLINSFLRLRNVDPGFRTDKFLTMRIVLPEPKYREPAQRSAFYSDLTRRLEAVPGVKSAAVTTNLPLYKQGNSIGITIEGRPEPPPGQEIIVVTRIISPRYFETMSIPLLRGRPLTDKTRPRLPPRWLSAKQWRAASGPARIRLANASHRENLNLRGLVQIVGIVKDVRQFDLIAEPRPQMYFSYQQAGSSRRATWSSKLTLIR